jgi:hypothetical protein
VDFFKLGLLTCGFYFGLTIVLLALRWALAHFTGLSVFVSARHPGLSLGLLYGAILGAAWLISFSAAWWIVYLDPKSRLPILQS